MERNAIIHEGKLIFKRWKNEEMEINNWDEKFKKNPRNIISRLRIENDLVERAKSIRIELERIDTSIQGEEEVLIWKKRLLEDRDVPALLDAEAWLRSARSRISRHRSRLMEAIIELKNKKKWDHLIDINNLNLQELRNAVRAAEGGKTHLIRSLNKNEEEVEERIVQLHPLLQHALEQIKIEIEVFSEEGWDVKEIEERIKVDPINFGKRLPSIRRAMDRHAGLVDRLKRLPWTRDPVLAEQILADLRRPNRLEALEVALPDLAKRLALVNKNDELFDFNPWMPMTNEIENVVVNDKESMGGNVPQMGVLEESIGARNSPVENEKRVRKVKKVKRKKISKSEIQSRGRYESSDSIMLQQNKKEIHITEKLENHESKGNIIAKIENTDAVEDDIHRTEKKNEQVGSEIGLGLQHIATALEIKYESGEHIRTKIAKKIGAENRDLRIDRILRLALRISATSEDDEDREGLLLTLTKAISEIDAWTKKRLEARGTSTGGDPLRRSERLGTLLQRIPGPGIALPLGPDTFALPSNDNLTILSQEVEKLVKVVNLPIAQGIRPAGDHILTAIQ